jgi:hypothetical protein
MVFSVCVIRRCALVALFLLKARSPVGYDDAAVHVFRAVESVIQ